MAKRAGIEIAHLLYASPFRCLLAKRFDIPPYAIDRDLFVEDDVRSKSDTDRVRVFSRHP
jgi:hypothetical protein